jgi:hypothetical protein
MSRWIRTAAVLAAATAALSGCSAGGLGTPAWTAAGTPSPGMGAPGPSTDTASPGAQAPGTAAAAPGATASALKVFTDPAKGVNFELPQEWIAQSVPPDPGSMAGALKIEVKDAAGGYLCRTVKARN